MTCRCGHEFQWNALAAKVLLSDPAVEAPERVPPSDHARPPNRAPTGNNNNRARAHRGGTWRADMAGMGGHGVRTGGAPRQGAARQGGGRPWGHVLGARHGLNRFVGAIADELQEVLHSGVGRLSMCADCQAGLHANTAWASLSLGCTLCIDCAGYHRGAFLPSRFALLPLLLPTPLALSPRL